jgi:hypothetical protein
MAVTASAATKACRALGLAWYRWKVFSIDLKRRMPSLSREDGLAATDRCLDCAGRLVDILLVCTDDCDGEFAMSWAEEPKCPDFFARASESNLIDPLYGLELLGLRLLPIRPVRRARQVHELALEVFEAIVV